MKTAVFPGSFDPFTNGHQSIVLRALPLFDKIIIAVGQNSKKSSFYPIEKRTAWIKSVFRAEKKVSVETYKGLTVAYCREVGARYILRGLRTSADFEFEFPVAQTNKEMDPEIETIFMLSLPEHAHIHSSVVRDIIRNGGDAGRFVPVQIKL
jgi:pantetheine-phosphate adenylyltransferase